MKKSIRFKLTVIVSLLLAAMILLSWAANRTLLAGYYQNKKVKLLDETFTKVNEAVAASDGTETEVFPDEETLNQLEKIEASYNVSVYVISVITSSLSERTTGLYYVYPIEADMNETGSFSFIRNDKYMRISSALKRYIFDARMDNSDRKDDSFQILKTEDDKYDVFKLFDPGVESSYIDLVGFLDSGYMVFIRSNYENIQESTDISSRFIAFSGFAILIIGIIAMIFISRSLTHPILKLAEISDRMAGLDFETKYTGNRHDEIGILGNSINTLSDKLEDTITELKTANIELEKDIARKTEIDEMRKEFLSNVSHELKTPIALIQGYAEGLQDNINDDDAESRNFYCEVIIDESRKMNNMVKKLLSLNEIEFGSNKLDLERFDIVELVRTISSSMELIAKGNEVSVVFNDHAPVYVWADESMIEEVVTNYLSNAIHYASGSRIVDIKFTETAENKIRVSVFNTGDNISDDDLENIWVKFYKVDKARTREYGGNGIGLSIVKAIMEQHNEKYGVINHSSGVEFWFELDMKHEITEK